MKLSIFGSIGFILSLKVVMAAPSCQCDPSDTDCILKCVQDTNSCVTACNGDTTCYEQCIYGWPGVESPSTTGTSGFSTETTVTVQTTAASETTGTTVLPTTTMSTSEPASTVTEAMSSGTDLVSNTMPIETSVAMSSAMPSGSSVEMSSAMPTAIPSTVSSAAPLSSYVSSILASVSSTVSVSASSVMSQASSSVNNVVATTSASATPSPAASGSYIMTPTLIAFILPMIIMLTL